MKKKSKKPALELSDVFVESFSHDGRGIARIDGKTTFIKGALAIETVSFAYLRQKKDFADGKLLSVSIPSPSRVEPKCQHYSMCGGCSLQHLDSDAAIREKEALLIDALERIGKVKVEKTLPPLTASLWHYRNKARLSVRHVAKKGQTLVGFRESDNPRYIADIDTCLILNKRVADEIVTLKNLLSSFDNPSSIAQIEVAAGELDIALIFRNLVALTANDEEKIQIFAKKTEFKIFLQPGGQDSVYLFYPKDVSEFLTYSLPSFDLEYKFHPTDFTQINGEINQLMVPMAIQLLELNKADIVLDLFCGLGNFSLPLAKKCRQVFGIEGSVNMVKRAGMNAFDNAIENITFIDADLEKEDILDNKLFKNVNKLLIDPPRTGAYTLVKQIDKLNIERIVYISCNPLTLARDAGVLVNQHGYKMLSAGVMDMFPHTSHVESIAVFVKG